MMLLEIDTTFLVSSYSTGFGFPVTGFILAYNPNLNNHGL
ncbi:hypothetical protein KCTC52924_01700 [Arenibacter antarcticus]